MQAATTLPSSASASEPVKGDWCTPPTRSTNRAGTSDHPSSTPRTSEAEQDRPVRVDPEHAEQREEEEPARVGPRLGQDQQLQREPDQGEVEPAVTHHDAGDADGEQQDDGGHPPAAAPSARA